MPSKVILLTGAPDVVSLRWNSTELLETFIAPVARFAGLQSAEDIVAPSSVDLAKSNHATWRSLELERQYLATGHSQNRGWIQDYKGNATFLTTSNISFVSTDPDMNASQPHDSQSQSLESVEEVLSQYYEHSYAIHTNLASSQIVASLPNQQLSFHDVSIATSLDSKETSFASTTYDFSPVDSATDTAARRPIPIGGQIADLKDIPNAKYLTSIQPQTMTVNLIVGVISISAPRGIKTRRGADVELVELIVGDETKSGFEINFWLSSNTNYNKNKDNEIHVKDILSDIRPQDIVLLRNVAVSSFRGRVYGQSLRKEITKVHLLYRNRIDRSDLGGCYRTDDLESGRDHQCIKTSQVREWVLRFVGPAAFRKAGKQGIEVIKEDLPPDTQ
jgi:hypothetical protein